MSNAREWLASLKIEVKGCCVVPTDEDGEFEVIPARYTAGKEPNFWGVYIRQGALVMHVQDYPRFFDVMQALPAMRAMLNTLMWWAEEMEQ